MSTERTQPDLSIAKAIFLDACELPPAQRMSLIDERCSGDVSLRAAVQSLLDANDRAGEFLEEPLVNRENLAAAVGTAAAAAAADAASAKPESLPRMIGRYRLLEMIGEGGFGAVYMAEQQDPVRRRVAVKVIKLGMDTRQVITRFEAERQALAMMDHPNIAQVFDAGADEAGRPYFVMELVRGMPITEYCDCAELSTRERLELFINVCHAVQHAHQKGVIHRDIKPSNILVTLHDGTPVPKVIDFGIAKAMHQRLTERTMFTAFRQFLGTPQYMSPEQAEMSGLDADTRSDVYSLGALLYELLTGTTPLEEATLQEAAYERVWQMVREADPPPPSTRVSTMGAARTAVVAAHRHSDPGRLAKLLRGELDWVVMKSLEKARDRRYDSPGSLAADLRRYLADEPVQARPTSVAYRLRKLAKRHKTGVAAALAIGAALLIGMSGTTIGMLRARAAQKRAQSAEQSALQERNAARDAQRRAEQSAADARREAARATAVGESMRGILGAVRPNVDAGNPYTEAEQILGTITAQISGKLKDQPDEQIQACATLADTLQRVELYTEAIEQWRRAYELSASLPGGANSRRTLELACNLTFARYLAGEGDQAEPLARRTCDAAKRLLGGDDPMTWKAINALALATGHGGRREESHALWESLVARLSRDPAAQSGDVLGRVSANWAGSLREQQGRAVEADAAIATALRLLREDATLTVERRGRVAREMSTSLEVWGDLPDALTVARDALRDQRQGLGNAHESTRGALAWAARLCVEADQLEEAEAMLAEYLPSALAANPRGTISMANRLADDAALKVRGGDLAGAAERFSQSISLRHRLWGHDTWVSEADWRTWTLCCNPALGASGWSSETLRDHVWCALCSLLRDNAPLRLVPEEVRVAQLRFKLLPWPPPPGTTTAEGTLQDLKKLPVPVPGLYLLGLEVPRGERETPLRRANWLLISPWEIAVHPIRRPDVEETRWARAVSGQPLERRRSGALAMNDCLRLLSGESRRLHWFGVVAGTTFDLPAGRYRFSVTANDGANLQLDGRPLLNCWRAYGNTFDAEALLSAGAHELRVDYNEMGSRQMLWLQAAPMDPAARAAAAALGGGVPEVDSAVGSFTSGAKENPTDAGAAYLHAHALARSGRFEESAAALERVIALDSGHNFSWYMRACLLAYLGDVPGHREACRAMIGRFGQSTERQVCQRSATACLLLEGPAAAVEVAQAQELMERALAAQTPAAAPFWDQMTRGLLDYRAGRFERAAGRLTASLGVCPEDLCAIRATSGLYLAMSEHRAGHESEARATFERAMKLFDGGGIGQPGLDDLNHGGLENWLIAQIARREAERMMPTRLPTDRP